MSIGKNKLPNRTGRPTVVSADGVPEWGAHGYTIAWGALTAVNTLTTLSDGTQVWPGEKYIESGTPLVPITTAEVQTVDLSGDDDPTGGTWDLTILGETLEDLAWNISAADLQTAIRGLQVQGSSDLTVTKVGFVYTINFPARLGNVAATTGSTAGLTGGSGDTFAITVSTTTAGVDYGGEWAPVDTSKSNGQQTIAREAVGILPYTIKDKEVSAFGADPQNEHNGLIVGGLVYREALKVGGTNQVTLANLLTAMPRLRLTKPV